MSIVGSHQLIDDLLVVICTLASMLNIVLAGKVEKVISSQDRLQTVSNHDDRQLSAHCLLDIENGVLHFFLAFWVKSARGFVKDQDLGALDECASDSNSLLLSA